MKKIFALVLALAMLLAVATAFAGTITITPPEGVDSDSTNEYRVYKVFDAVVGDAGISYTVMDTKAGLPVPAGFTVDSAGNVIYSTPDADELTADNIEAIRAYVAGDVPVKTVSGTGSSPVVITDLDDGYYFIDTTTGTMVTIDSTTEDNVEVKDKNTVPTVDKKITDASSIDDDGKKALAQAGTEVKYQSVITVGSGAKGYVFHDTMETGLTFNNDAEVMIGDTAVETSKYTVGQEGTDTFTIAFDDDFLKTLEKGTELTITYSATVNDDAITTDPLNNTVYVSYGDEDSNNKTPEAEADVYEAKFTVTKHDGKGLALGGAGFVLLNSEGKYYSNNGGIVSWVDDIGNATEQTSADDGSVPPFTGLADGTYTLHENTVPSGYNRAVDHEFTVAKGDYTASNLEQTAEVKNHAGAELPSTGGIGTTIFYVVGGLLVIGAAVILIARRRVNE